MKLKIVLLVAVFAMLQVLLVGVAPDVKANSITLFNTGVDGGGTSKSHGTSEDHYTLVSSPYTSRPVPLVRTSAGGFPIGPWVSDDPNSAWIVPNFDTDSGGLLNHLDGEYRWEFDFDLTGLDESTASITGDWATDDSGILLLNGSSTGNTASGFSTLTSFAINSGFQSGWNTLAFIVTNGVQATGNPTGLRVQNIAGTANAVPEPATITLLGIGLVGLVGGTARRKLKKKAVVNS